MKKFGVKRGIGFLFIGVAAITIFGFIVMGLWNSILVSVLHVSIISFWQALGILVLSKILFSGFPGERHHGPHNSRWGRKEIYEKWEAMTPEEREKFKQDWRGRCRNWKEDMRQQKDEKAE